MTARAVHNKNYMIQEKTNILKRLYRSDNSAAHDHLLHCNYLPSFENFSFLAN